MIAITFWILLLLEIVRGLPQCYPSIVPVVKPKLDDCVSVVDMIQEGDKSSAPMQFSRDSARGFRVPHYWVNNTCSVKIDLVGRDEDTMKLSEIAFVAASILYLCIGRPGHPNLGGIDMAGPWLTMRVMVGGHKRVPSYLDSELNLPTHPGVHSNESLTINDQTA